MSIITESKLVLTSLISDTCTDVLDLYTGEYQVLVSNG